jgi:hypothetical protein
LRRNDRGRRDILLHVQHTITNACLVVAIATGDNTSL